MASHSYYALLVATRALETTHSASTTAAVGVLLLNLGTPDNCELSSVRRYLREFLMDARVIDVPWLLRFLLVQCIIVPFRGPVSTREYRKLWTEKGSPLQYHTQSLSERLAAALGERYVVRYAMRYQQPSLFSVLSELQARPLSQLILLPLFPQYASATTGSVVEAVCRQLQRWKTIPSLSLLSQFHLRPAFLSAWAAQAEPYLKHNDWDIFLFSYHGLPERQIRKCSLQNHCQLGSCCEKASPANQYCYRAQCFRTTAALAARLQLPSERCRTVFQSRLGSSPWLQPYTEDTIRSLSTQGTKRILAFSPSFVADCLETTVEIGETYKELFLSLGGTALELIPSLNDSSLWVKALQKWIQQLSLTSQE